MDAVLIRFKKNILKISYSKEAETMNTATWLHPLPHEHSHLPTTIPKPKPLGYSVTPSKCAFLIIPASKQRLFLALGFAF